MTAQTLNERSKAGYAGRSSVARAMRRLAADGLVTLSTGAKGITVRGLADEPTAMSQLPEKVIDHLVSAKSLREDLDQLAERVNDTFNLVFETVGKVRTIADALYGKDDPSVESKLEIIGERLDELHKVITGEGSTSHVVDCLKADMQRMGIQLDELCRAVSSQRINFRAGEQLATDPDGTDGALPQRVQTVS